MPLTAGARLGQYEIQAPLGSGGMGEVYKAHDPTLQRTVAIKVLATQDEDASARLLQEARAASALDHPNICTVYEVGEATPSRQPSPLGGEGAVSFIVMPTSRGNRSASSIPRTACRQRASSATGRRSPTPWPTRTSTASSIGI